MNTTLDRFISSIETTHGVTTDWEKARQRLDVGCIVLLLTSKKIRYTIAASRAKDKLSSKYSVLDGELIVGQAVNFPSRTQGALITLLLVVFLYFGKYGLLDGRRPG